LPIPIKAFTVIKTKGHGTIARLTAQFATLEEAESFARQLHFATRIYEDGQLVKKVSGLSGRSGQ